MKKFTKLALCALSVALIGGTLAFAACGGGDDSGKVSDSDWSKYLNFDYETYDSFTITTKSYSTYGKDKVDEYGEWENRSYSTKVDTKNSIIYSYSVDEYYSSYANDGEGGFVTSTYENYYLLYNGSYYCWSKSNDGEADVYSITKASFISEVETSSAETSMFSAVASMKSMFDYNSSTGMYEMSSAGYTLSIQFNDNEIRLIEPYTSIETGEIILSNLNSTTISVPASVYSAIDAYIARQA